MVDKIGQNARRVRRGLQRGVGDRRIEEHAAGAQFERVELRQLAQLELRVGRFPRLTQSDVRLYRRPGIVIDAGQQQIGSTGEVELLLQCRQRNERVERRDLAGLQTEPAELRVRCHARNFEPERNRGIFLG